MAAVSGWPRGPGEERGAPERGVYSLRLVAGSLCIGVRGRLEMAPGRQRLDAGVAAAHPHDSEVGDQVEQSVDDRLENSGEEARRSDRRSPRARRPAGGPAGPRR